MIYELHVVCSSSYGLDYRTLLDMFEQNEFGIYTTVKFFEISTSGMTFKNPLNYYRELRIYEDLFIKDILDYNVTHNCYLLKYSREFYIEYIKKCHGMKYNENVMILEKLEK